MSFIRPYALFIQCFLFPRCCQSLVVFRGWCAGLFLQADKPSIYITREEFNNSISNDVEKIEKFLSECILQAGVKNEDIDLVILTGGSTEVPRVSEIATKFFPNAEVSAGDKLSSVGMGLAYDARRIFL